MRRIADAIDAPVATLPLDIIANDGLSQAIEDG
jgi:hypothetical protein